MPAKRPLWENRTIIINYLINIIHLLASPAITPARASGTAVEKRDSANLSIFRFDYNNCHVIL
ncbi:MAG: hypothetical protein OER74_20255, partial [Desulfobacteraceae bacterium]|nr:hypothetical protein [Desulfobacteraceae bacterium]